MSSSIRPPDPLPNPPSSPNPNLRSAPEVPAAPAWRPVRIAVNGKIWHVRPGWEWLVYGQRAPNWLHLIAEPNAEPIKRNAAREVWRVRVEGQDYFAKLYRETGLSGKIRSLFRGTGCKLEWRASRHALKHQIATVDPIAYGEVGLRGLGGPGIFITHGLPQALPLNEYWQRKVLTAPLSRRREVVNAVIEAAATAVARAHQFGFHHRDLHAGNLLATEEPDGRPRVVFVDLHNVRVGRRVPDDSAIRNLAQLNQWFRLRATRTDRLRFQRFYMAFREELSRRTGSGPSIQLSSRDFVEALERAARRHARALWAKRDRVAMRNGKYFCHVKARGGWRGHAFLRAKHPSPHSRASRMHFAPSQWRNWLSHPKDLIRRDRPGVIKDSHSAYVGRTHLPTQDGPLEVIVKQGRRRTFFKRISRLFAPSRNLQSWKKGYQLLNRDLPTARPLAVLERRRFGLLRDSVLLTEALPGARDFDTFLRLDLLHANAETVRKAKSRLLEALVRLIKDMQQKGFAHRDFKAANLMVQYEPASGEPPRLTLVDLDGLSLRRELSWEERLRPIVRLNVSMDEAKIVTRTDRLRFLKAYLIGPGRSDANWKEVWRQIQSLSDRKRAHKEKRRQWKLKHYGRP